MPRGLVRKRQLLPESGLKPVVLGERGSVDGSEGGGAERRRAVLP